MAKVSREFSIAASSRDIDTLMDKLISFGYSDVCLTSIKGEKGAFVFTKIKL